jgi:membrane fusion protein, multidrug efflux system
MNNDARAAQRTKPLPATAIVLIAIVLLGVVLWRLDHAPSTDDAYVYADTINVVPEVSGRIIELPVRDNQAVRQGDLLLRIDPRPYQAALNQARARLDTLNHQAADTLHRTEPLLAQGYVSADEVDRERNAQRSAQAELNAAMLQAQQASAAVSGVDALVAQRAEVEAQIAIAELNLEFTEVRAPFNGRVVSLRTTVGQFASALKPVFTLIDTRHWYVVANFRETELKNVHAGTPSTVYLMSDTAKRFAGVVDSIGYGVLPDDGGTVQEGLPAVQRTINWVHVSQRFPVKIAVRNPDPELFRIGTSAVATLELGDAAAPRR